jgi:hypothetical protein
MSGRTIAKQYPRLLWPVLADSPPSITRNVDAPVISNDTIAGIDSASGDAGSVLKSVGTLTLVVAMANWASDGKKTSASSVVIGATMRLVAPSTETSSRTLLPRSTSPSTS